jgi:hypothetical protein
MDVPGRDRFVLRQCRHIRGVVSLPLRYEEVALSLRPVGADVLDNLARTLRILCSDCKIPSFCS